MAFLWVRMLSQLLFMSLFTRFFSYTHLAIRLLLFPLGAIFWSYIPVYFIGVLQNNYKKTYQVYVDEIKECKTLPEKIVVKEKWEKNSYFRNYEFYFFSALIAIASSTISII